MLILQCTMRVSISVFPPSSKTVKSMNSSLSTCINQFKRLLSTKDESESLKVQYNIQRRSFINGFIKDFGASISKIFSSNLSCAQKYVALAPRSLDICDAPASKCPVIQLMALLVSCGLGCLPHVLAFFQCLLYGLNTPYLMNVNS